MTAGISRPTERYVAFFSDAVSPEEEERTFAEAWQYIGDPNLFQSVEEVQTAIATWPLQPTTVLNGSR